MSSVHTKICGIKTPDILEAAAEAGARFVGFVFYPPSPRHVAVDVARELALRVPTGVKSVGLFVDPSDDALEAVLGTVPLDMIQLHGVESVARCAEIKARFGLPVMKAFSVREAADIARARDYEEAIDWILFDAKPEDGDLPGGTGRCFDWSLLARCMFSRPWMLSGGLTPENVSEALSVLSPNAVDVSSGVEAVRGEKDAGKIRAFIATVGAV